MGTDEERYPVLEDEEEKKFQGINLLFICHQSIGPQTQTWPQITSLDPHIDYPYNMWFLQSLDHNQIFVFLESLFHFSHFKSKFIYSLHGHHLVLRG